MLGPHVRDSSLYTRLYLRIYGGVASGRQDARAAYPSVDFSCPARASRFIAASASLKDSPCTLQPVMSASIRGHLPHPALASRARPVRRTPARHAPPLPPLARRAPFPGARVVSPSLPAPPNSPNNMKHVQHKTLECNIRLKQIKHLEHILATYL